MKHIKLFEDLSSPVSSELLGIDPKFLTKEYCLHLIEKYAKVKDGVSLIHLSKLITKYHPEYFNRDPIFVQKMGVLMSKYDIENIMHEFFPKELPGERDAAEKEYERAKNRLEYRKRIETAIPAFEKEFKTLMRDLVYKHNLDGTGLTPMLEGFIKKLLNDYMEEVKKDGM